MQESLGGIPDQLGEITSLRLPPWSKIEGSNPMDQRIAELVDEELSSLNGSAGPVFWRQGREEMELA